MAGEPDARREFTVDGNTLWFTYPSVTHGGLIRFATSTGRITTSGRYRTQPTAEHSGRLCCRVGVSWLSVDACPGPSYKFLKAVRDPLRVPSPRLYQSGGAASVVADVQRDLGTGPEQWDYITRQMNPELEAPIFRPNAGIPVAPSPESPVAVV